jgi:hypothetical protein
MLSSNKNIKVSKKKVIRKTWLSGQYSCTLIIPKEIADEYGLAETNDILVEGCKNGILIRRVINL